MSWLPTIVPFLAAILVVGLQGVSFFWKAPGTEDQASRRLAGTLNLFMAAGCLVAFLLFQGGALIASPEFGIVLVQGSGARLWACILLVGTSLAFGLVWEVARHVKETARFRGRSYFDSDGCIWDDRGLQRQGMLR